MDAYKGKKESGNKTNKIYRKRKNRNKVQKHKLKIKLFNNLFSIYCREYSWVKLIIVIYIAVIW